MNQRRDLPEGDVIMPDANSTHSAIQRVESGGSNQYSQTSPATLIAVCANASSACQISSSRHQGVLTGFWSEACDPVLSLSLSILILVQLDQALMVAGMQAMTAMIIAVMLLWSGIGIVNGATLVLMVDSARLKRKAARAQLFATPHSPPAPGAASHNHDGGTPQ